VGLGGFVGAAFPQKHTPRTQGKGYLSRYADS
jgi:hypothetical protein